MAKQLDIEELIKQLLISQKQVAHALNKDIGKKSADKSILSYFDKVNNNCLYVNSAISKKVADYSQLLNEKKNFDKASLKDIKRIYEGLVRIHPLDIEFYESLAFYLNNVEDCPEEAKMILTSGIAKIEKKIKSLKKEMKKFR